MRFLNHLANRVFAIPFSYLLNVLNRDAYVRIVDARSSFGDYDLTLGTVKQNLGIAEVPVRYKERTYRETQISRFRDGMPLICMAILAFRKLKAI